MTYVDILLAFLALKHVILSQGAFYLPTIPNECQEDGKSLF